ncbi:hypothetical protein SAMN04488128_106442 [Chitinophaga eiseniae]|uniref:Uncharacterized protein n=1 Tax=Chitinophaga eiseniae TaxID=634771 RepID=A0A1T4TW57_9BACT|nr:hypothetical protein [Chitinophaga eiseniae]SKA44568.1 hypothetical protein SAMN04488128_106442 [Chitinophaga eiseniae]
MRPALFWCGLATGLVAAALSVGYAVFYQSALGVDFSRVAPVPAIISANMGAAMLVTLACWLAERRTGAVPRSFNRWLVLFSALSAGIPFMVNLPLDISAPELFPGLMAPMHLLPALIWLALQRWWTTGSRADGRG